ncbi:hypothetical protein FRC04_003314 [Tulasnella sp. 424]|nr:hypothetical protein FRC04_003314 [Tulasnella sp. 424]
MLQGMRHVGLVPLIMESLMSRERITPETVELQTLMLAELGFLFRCCAKDTPNTWPMHFSHVEAYLPGAFANLFELIEERSHEDYILQLQIGLLSTLGTMIQFFMLFDKTAQIIKRMEISKILDTLWGSCFAPSRSLGASTRNTILLNGTPWIIMALDVSMPSWYTTYNPASMNRAVARYGPERITLRMKEVCEDPETSTTDGNIKTVGILFGLIARNRSVAVQVLKAGLPKLFVGAYWTWLRRLKDDGDDEGAVARVTKLVFQTIHALLAGNFSTKTAEEESLLKRNVQDLVDNDLMLIMGRNLVVDQYEKDFIDDEPSKDLATPFRRFDNMDNGLTEYEQERADNIRKNAELLALLDVEAIHDEMGIPAPVATGKGKAKAGGASSSTASKPKPVPARNPKVKREREEDSGPLRRSTRRKTGPADPNESPESKRKREEEEEERREAFEREREEERERARLAKLPRHHDLDLQKLIADAPKEETDSLQSTFTSILSKKYPRAVGSGTTSRDGEIKTDQKLEEVRDEAKKAKIRSRAKVTQERIYCMAYHPSTSKDLVFFGDKYGTMGIWDPLAPGDEIVDEDGEVEVSEGGQNWRLQVHWPQTSKTSISAMKFDPTDAHNVITSSYDCTIRITSFETGISREIFHAPDTLISSFDMPTESGNEIWISDVQGHLSHIDLREDSKTARRRFEMNGTGHKIGCVSVNPVSPQFLVTSSNDRTVKLWDSRKLFSLPVTTSPRPPAPAKSSTRRSKVKNEEEDAEDDVWINETSFEEVNKYLEGKKGRGLLRGEHPSGAAVSSAYWDPSGRRIVSTCYDDHLREDPLHDAVWDVAPSSLVLDTQLPKFAPTASVRHNCQTGRWLTVLKAQWMPSPDVYPHFVVGNMNQSLDIIGFNGEKIANLVDRNLVTAVQAVAGSHPSRVGRYASGNASGRCVLWAPEDDS